MKIVVGGLIEILKSVYSPEEDTLNFVTRNMACSCVSAKRSGVSLSIVESVTAILLYVKRYLQKYIAGFSVAGQGYPRSLKYPGRSFVRPERFYYRMPSPTRIEGLSIK